MLLGQVVDAHARCRRDGALDDQSEIRREDLLEHVLGDGLREMSYDGEDAELHRLEEQLWVTWLYFVGLARLPRRRRSPQPAPGVVVRTRPMFSREGSTLCGRCSQCKTSRRRS